MWVAGKCVCTKLHLCKRWVLVHEAPLTLSGRLLSPLFVEGELCTWAQAPHSQVTHSSKWRFACELKHPPLMLEGPLTRVEGSYPPLAPMELCMRAPATYTPLSQAAKVERLGSSDLNDIINHYHPELWKENQTRSRKPTVYILYTSSLKI